MKHAFRTMIAATIIGLAGACGAAAEPLKVGFAAEPYPPFASPDASGNWEGWEVEFMQAMCKQAKLECVITPVAWDGIIPALTSKKIDMIVGSMSITPERLKTIDFSDKYYNTPTGVIGPKSEKFAATPEGLKGKTIGVQVATIHQDYATKYFGGAGATVKEYQTQDEANADLAAGRLDAVLADKFVLYEWLEKSTDGKCCKFVGPDLKDVNPQGTGIAVRKEDNELREALNKAIKEIEADGTFAKINAKYFPFPIN